MSDPAGLLTRVPELEPFTRYPGVKKALASGRPHKVYRALFWGRLFGRFKADHKRVAKELLANRRLFIEPVDSAPGHSTINGIGTMMLGNVELDGEDGTSIGTQFFTFIYVPVFPLGQYLWLKHGNQYQVFGKVPYGPLVYLWRNALAVLIAVGILGAAGSAFYGSRYDEVIVLNALDVEVVAKVGDDQKTVPAGKKRTFVAVPIGEVPVAIQIGDEPFEEGVIEVSSLNDVHLWNVAGAGLVYFQDVVYVVSGSAGNIRDPDQFCGVNAIVLDDVDYLFRQPPETIQMSSDRIVRTHLGLFEGGWESCMDTLQWTQPALVTQMLVDRTDLVDEAQVDTLGGVMIRAWGPQAAVAWTDERIAEGNGTVAIHRLRQSASSAAGVDLSEEYRAAAEADPESATSAYLYLRLQPPGEEVVRALEDALERWPSDGLLLRTYAYNLRATERFAEAEGAYESLFTRVDIDRVLAPWAEMLAASGRHELALEKLESVYEPDWNVIVARGKLRVLLRLDSRASEWEGLDRVLFEAQVGVPLDAKTLKRIDPEIRPAVRATAALHRDPVEALALFGEVPPDQIHWIDMPSAALILGELRASGRGEDAATFAEAYGAPFLEAIESGEVHSEDHAGALGSALFFAASRQPERTPEEAAALRERAARWDFFPGVTTHALANW